MSQIVDLETDLIPLHRVENVRENKTSKREKRKAQIVNYVVKDVRKLPNLSKFSLTWIQRACDLIENIVKKKNKIDKW